LRRDGRIVVEQEHFLPLYEGKYIAQMNHRFGTFADVPTAKRFGTKAEALDPNTDDLRDCSYEIVPRYWLSEIEARRLYEQKRSHHLWLFTFRDVCRAIVDARTVQACVMPRLPCLDGCPLLLFDPPVDDDAVGSLLFNTLWASFVFDYAARQKIHGAHLTKAIAYQLPVPSPDMLEIGVLGRSFWAFVRPRALELTFVTDALNDLATANGIDGPPFRWDEERRFILRCELDAAYFHLYLGSEDEWGTDSPELKEMLPTPRDAADYIMETFPIVKRKDIARTADENGENGCYVTKDTILEIYDEMAEAIRTGQAYQTRLAPPPGPPTDADGKFIPMAEWDPNNWPPHIHPPRKESEVKP